MPFELLGTLRWTPQERWRLLERHLARLETSARRFQFSYSEVDARRALEEAVQHAESPLRVRLLLDEAGTFRVEQTPLDTRAGPWRVRLAREPIDPTDPFLYHKTTNRAVYERARLPDCDDVILWNGAGEATES